MQASTQRRPTFTETARRAQIVQAAVETIAERGLARSSYARIAERAGLSSTGLISYHFVDKDDLIDQVVGEVVSAGQAYMLPAIHAAPPGRARLRAYIESNLAFMRTHHAHIVAAANILSSLPRELDGQPRPYAERHERGIAQLAEILREGQRGGELRDFVPRVMAIAIRAAIDAVAYRTPTDADLDLDAYGRELADLFDHATRR